MLKKNGDEENYWKLYGIIEQGVKEHTQLVSEARSLIDKIEMDPDDERSQSLLLSKLRRMLIVRKRLQNAVLSDKSLRESEDVNILLEYLDLIGLEEEREALEKCRKLALQGALVLKANLKELQDMVSNLEKFKHKLENLLP